ncbi:Protein-tyrosine-phosphatase MKP1 [Phytophthora citrophthora]|uniref:Protein-tyrosine-phosphatase MKP1 n=1 Tax=Phytophthora citrophthora TaxID=4793 RepID=A0AAD9G2Y0_9STRA|nr:Protein-tyrosine-phosphatase MKP1 [Phytophthora citrophthora]
MGNGQSRDGFAGVLPSASTAQASNADPPPISDAWTGEQCISDWPEDSGVKVPPPQVGKIVPPSHALQREEPTARLSREASEVVRAFNSVERVDDRFAVPESVRKSRTLDAYVDVCSEILSGFLYVSNFRVARDMTKLRALGITHVINCCGELKHYENGVELPETSDAAVNTMKLLLRDDANEDLTPFLPQVMEFISSCREEKGKVLVHCHQGVSRSCAFAIAYVMLDRTLSYHEASALVKRQRAISSPNAAFICQLLEWEKDLQAMRKGGSSFALDGLYRLTPHFSYDAQCLVLKRCYEPSAGPARQRQNLAKIRTQDDGRRLLWSRGTFVFVSPTTAKLMIWHGSKCEIPEAVSRAKQLAGQLLRLQTLVQPDAVPVILEVFDCADNEETGTDHFGYAAELEWGTLKPQGSSLLQSTNGNASNGNPEASVPQLFILEAIGDGGDDLWDQVTNYDSEDLTPDSVFLLFSAKKSGLVEGFVWIGSNCTSSEENVLAAAQNKIKSLGDDRYLPELSTEHQNQESDAFWELFEAGY